MDTGIISTRYARALWLYAHKKRACKRVYKEMVSLTLSFETVGGLQAILCDPMISGHQKLSLLCNATGGKPGKTFTRFIALVIANKREEYLYAISRIYQSIYHEQLCSCPALLITASPLSEELCETIRRLIASRTDAVIELATVLKPEILGGFILEVADWMLDASVTGRLGKVSRQLLALNNFNYANKGIQLCTISSK